VQLSKKQTFVSELSSKIKDANTFAILSFNKVNVATMTGFRIALKKQGLFVKVAKNTLLKRALDSTPYKELGSTLKGTSLIVYSHGDVVTSAKSIVEWLGKEDFSVDIKAAMAMGQIVDKSKLVALSKLPGRKELLTGFLFALTGVPKKVLFALEDAPRKLCYAIIALKEKKGES